MRLDDDDPFWDKHTGRSGHTADPEWAADDTALAEAFYPLVQGNTKVFLDLLIDRPGELIESTWIALQMIASDHGPTGRAGPQVVANSIRGMSLARDASGRRYPFKWWRGKNGSPTRYAMKPTVAELFHQARLTTSQDLSQARSPS
jgi:hypothetical protein